MTECKYTIYFTDTGRVHCLNECGEDQLPAPGPLEADPNLSVIHGHLDPKKEMVRSGKRTPLPEPEKRQREDAALWFEFRQKRRQLLEASDKPVSVPDFPITREELRAVKTKRKASRDIPQKTTDPKIAMQMLEKLWENEDQEASQ